MKGERTVLLPRLLPHLRLERPLLLQRLKGVFLRRVLRVDVWRVVELAEDAVGLVVDQKHGGDLVEVQVLWRG